MIKLSTVIMCMNEEDKIARCIRSVQEISDEVLIVDSFSTDRTVEIAESLGARIETRAFQGYIEQRALSVSLATNDWVLALDADEFLSPGLIEEIKQILLNPVPTVLHEP
jgi:glycosyltransferase involved in cell wall biosynthesis